MISTTRPSRICAVATATAALIASLPFAMASANAETTDNWSAATAAQPATELPEASELFERYIEAIGGWEKIEKIKSRRIKGTYQGDPFEFRANLTTWWEADGRFHQIVSEPAGKRFELFAVNDMTWSKVKGGEPRPIGGIQRQELLDTADFHGEANYKNRYKEIKTVRQAKAGDTPVYVVSAKTHAGRPHTLFFAKDSGLLIGNRVPVTGEKNAMRDMTIRILNYKDIGGVLYPTLFIQEFGGDTKPSRFEFTSIEVNTEDDHDYTVPESVREMFESELDAASDD